MLLCVVLIIEIENKTKQNKTTFGPTQQHVGPEFPNQELNPYPLDWKAES